MNKFFLTAAMVVLTAMQASAFSGEDETQVLFTCKSLPYADSAITVVGVADELLTEVQVIYMVAGEVKVEDKGVLVENTSRYEGRFFVINFDETVTITGKAKNPVLRVGQSDSLSCELHR